jgi:hypothetical protein
MHVASQASAHNSPACCQVRRRIACTQNRPLVIETLEFGLSLSRDPSMARFRYGVEKVYGLLSLAVTRCVTPVTAAVELVCLNWTHRHDSLGTFSPLA